MKIYIADDEPLAARRLQVLLERMGEGSDICTFADGTSLVTALRRDIETGRPPDLLLLDVEMPGLTGLEVLGQIANRCGHMQVVISSASEQHAFPAFGLGVTDYLLKPCTPERLRQAVEKAKEQLRLLSLDQRSASRQHQDTALAVRTTGATVMVQPNDIVSIEALGDYLRLHLTHGQRLVTLCTLASMAEALPPGRFVRTHRSHVVNLTHVSSYTRQQVTLSDGRQVPIGKTYRAATVQALDHRPH